MNNKQILKELKKINESFEDFDKEYDSTRLTYEIALKEKYFIGKYESESYLQVSYAYYKLGPGIVLAQTPEGILDYLHSKNALMHILAANIQYSSTGKAGLEFINNLRPILTKELETLSGFTMAIIDGPNLLDIKLVTETEEFIDIASRLLDGWR
jgi:hypothetical protein